MLLNETNHELNSELLNGNINLKLLMNVLGVTDIRTAVSWCKRNGIFIFKIGREKYVNKIEFELAIDKPFIESLRIKYLENWKDVYSAIKKGEYRTILDQELQTNQLNKLKFVAPGRSGNNFIKKITKQKK